MLLADEQRNRLMLWLNGDCLNLFVRWRSFLVIVGKGRMQMLWRHLPVSQMP